MYTRLQIGSGERFGDDIAHEKVEFHSEFMTLFD